MCGAGSITARIQICARGRLVIGWCYCLNLSPFTALPGFPNAPLFITSTSVYFLTFVQVPLL
jgi:hypothetical protein